MEAPRIWMSFSRLKRPSMRVTVSRELPTRLASSSWVRAMVKRISFLPQAAARPQSSEAAGVEEGCLVLFAEGLGGVEAGLAVAGEEGEELIAANAFDLDGLEGLGGDLIAGAGDDGAEAEDVAGHGDLEDEGASVAGAAGELHLAGADDVDAAGGLIFLEEGGAARQAGRDADGVEVQEGAVVEVAEHAQGAQLAVHAIARSGRHVGREGHRNATSIRHGGGGGCDGRHSCLGRCAG
jgi:hypothetical protein